MASVHRHGKVYFAYFRIPNGRTSDGQIIWKQVKRATKETRPDKAFAKAVQLEAMWKEEAGAKDDRSSQFLHILRRAVDHAVRGLLTDAVAHSFLDEITLLATGRSIQVHTIEGWLNSWVGDKKRSKATGTHARYAGVIEAFLKHLPQNRRQLSLAALTPEDIREFRNSELDAGKSVNTANLAVKTLSIPLRLAQRQGILKSNPAEAVDRIAADSITKDIFTLEDLQSLVAVADRDWHGVILFGFFTGARLRDITNLKWSNLDSELRSVQFTASKTKREVQVPLHPEVKEHLLTLDAPDDTSANLFPDLAGKGTSGRSGLSMAFSRLMEKATLSGKSIEAKGEKGRTRRSLTFHSLRHSFTSYLANAGVSPELRQKLTGHLDAKTHQKYTHHVLETLNEAIKLLPAVGGAGQSK